MARELVRSCRGLVGYGKAGAIMTLALFFLVMLSASFSFAGDDLKGSVRKHHDGDKETPKISSAFDRGEHSGHDKPETHGEDEDASNTSEESSGEVDIDFPRSFAGVDMTVFGPKRYDRYKGAPNVYTGSFDRCDPSNYAVLRVTNGDGKETSITSGRISVNGKVVIAEHDFKQHVLKIEKPIVVRLHNELKVELKSSGHERSFVIVEVIGKGCDATAPVITAPTPADGALLKIARPLISAGYQDEANGSGINATSVRLSVDGVDVTASATVSANGVSYLPAADLPFGEHQVVLAVSDRAANTASLVWRFRTDTIPPEFKITSPVGGSYLNTPIISISGTINDPTAAIIVNGAAPLVTGGSFVLNGVTLTEGSNTISGTATDPAGNPATDAVSVVLDTLKPEITIASPADGVFVNTGRIAVSGSVDDVSNTISVNGLAATVSGTGFNLADLPLAEGDNSVAVTAADRATNSAVKAVTVHLDTVAPVIRVASPLADGWVNTPAISVSGTVVENNLQGLRINDVPVEVINGSFVLNGLALAEGGNSIRLFALDKAGNEATLTVSVHLDTVVPVVEITAPAAGLITNQAQVTVAGRVSEPFTTVAVNGVSATVTGTDYSATVTLTEGSNVLRVETVDRAGNAASSSVTVTSDSIPPVKPVLANLQPLTNVAQVSLRGTAEANSLVQVFASGAPVGTAKADAEGNFTLLNVTLAEGGNSFTATARDAAGNESALSDAVATVLDSIAPAAPALTALVTPTKVSAVTLSGTAEANSVVTVSLGGTVIGSVDAGPQGSFSLAGVTLADGANTFSATATDQAVNVSPASLPLVVVLDTKAPQLTVSTRADGSYTNNATLNITGAATDNVGMKELKVNGTGVTLNADGGYSHTIALQEGANRILVLAVDQAGNESSDSRTVNLDRAPPVITVAAPAENSKTKDPVLAFSGSVDAQARVELSLNGTVYQAVMDGLNFSAAVNAAYGKNIVEITAFDLADNRSSVRRTVIYDNKQPTVAVTDPAQDIRTNKGSHTITGDAGDELTAVSVTVAVEGQTFTPPVVNGRFEQVVGFGAEKSYAVTVTATDEVGLAATVQRNIVYDITPPELTIAAVTTPTNQATQVVSGTVEPGATVAVTCAGATVGSVSYPTGGTWSATLTNLTAGDNGVTVTARDATGNVSSANTAITYDNILPTGTIAINAGAAVTGSASVELQLTAADASGVAGMRFSNDGVTWTDTVAFATGSPWSLTAGDGMKQVLVRYLDRAGNWSNPIGAGITLDTTAPVVTIAAPAAGGFVNRSEAVVSGGVNEALLSVTVNGVPAAVSGLSWSLPVTLAEGSNSFAVVALDLAGNPGQGAVTVNLDTLVPVATVTAPKDAFLVNKRQLAVSGTVSEEFTTVTVNGTAATVTGSAYSLVYPLEEGANILEVRAADRAGNVGSVSVTGTLDSIAPAAPVFAPAATPTRIGTVSLSGDAEANATVKIYAADTLLATVTADTLGRFTLADVALSEGANTFTATATDKAVNESPASQPLGVVLDIKAPQLSVSTLANGSYTNNVTLNIAGSVVDNVEMQDLKVNGVPVPVNADGSYSHALALQDGPNAVDVVATDKAGNLTGDSRVVNLDRTAPEIKLSTPADNSKTKNPILLFEGSVDNEAVVELKMKDAVYPAAMTGLNFSASINASYGYNTVEITATDLAGNKSTIKRTVLFDDRQPSLSVTDPGQDIRTNQSSLTVKGSAGDELTAVTVSITMDGQTFAPALNNGGFQQSVTFGAEKSYALVVTATDEVGLSSSVQRNVIFDATPPALTVAPVASPTNQATQALTGTMEEGAIVSVTCATATVGPVSYPTAGTWSATVSDLSVGVNDLAVEARDATGNVGGAGASITYDNAGPTGTISVNSGSGVTGTASVQLQLNSTDSTGVTNMRFSTDGVTWTDATTYTVNAPWTLSAGDGLKQIYVQYQDKAGNWSNSVIEDEIILDTTAPVIAVASPAAASFLKTPQLVVSGTVNEPVASVSVNGTAATVSGLTWSLPHTLAEGENSLAVSAIDLAGNAASSTVAVTLDTKVPVVTIVTPAAGLTRIARVTVSGTVSEEAVQVTVNGMPAVVTGTDWSLGYTLAELGNTLNVTATDRAGNAGSASVSVTLDSTAPAAPVLAAPATPTKVATLDLTGTAEADATVKIFADAAQIGEVRADGQGNFSLAGVTLTEGGNSFTATATDSAGNESAPSAAIKVVLDTAAPVISVTAPVENAFLAEAAVTVTGSLDEVVSSLTINGRQVVVQGTAFQQAVTLTPGINSIVLAATDPAGNAATRTVLVTLDSEPPVVTITAPASGGITRVAQVTVSGSVSKPHTTATVNGTAVTVTDQTFNFVYTLQEGDNTLQVEATDRAGNKGSASVSLNLDSKAPLLSIQTVPDAVAGANVAISLSASDDNRLTLVELKADGVPIWSGGNTAGVAESVAYRLSPSLAGGSRVQLQARAVDGAGNEGGAVATIAISRGATGPGYLQGKVLDDGRGLRMEGAAVSLSDAEGTAHDLVSAADGGYFAELPAGEALVSVSRPGYTFVERAVTILPEKKAIALDARLTKISAGPNVVDAAGATVRAEVGTGTGKKVIELEVPAGAVAAQSDLRLTPVSNQGLAGLLPAGWSPLAAVDLRLLDPATGLPLSGGLTAAATFKFPLPASLPASGSTPVLAVYDAAAHQWRSKGSAAVAADGLSAGAGVDGAGEYALLIADPAPNAPAAVETGAPLSAATSASLDYETVAALGKVVPQASPPSTGLKAAGEVVLSAKDGASPLFTSGLVLNSRITENFDLKSGDSVQTPSYTQDIILYRHPCLTNIGSGALSAASEGTLRTTFPVAPSRDYTIVDLLLGKVGLEIGVPAAAETGVMVGADGGRLLDADGNILAIPQGALSQTTPVSTKTGAAAPGVVGNDFTLVKVIEVNLTGQTLALGATLSTAAPASLDPSLPLLLARQIEVKGVAKLKLVALIRQSGTLLSSDTALPGATLSGITGSGSYYLLQAKAPVGFVTGTVTDAPGNAYTGALVKTAQGSLVDVASAAGRYLVAGPVGPITATATDLYKNDEVSGSGALSAANQLLALDLRILMLPPTLVSVTPAGINIQPSAPVVATFSKSIDKASVSSATVTLKDASGNVVPGVFTFSVDGKVVTFSPNELLGQEQSYTVTVGTGIKDLQGYALGADSVSTFTVRKTTPPPMPPAGAVSGTFPDADGFITVTATQGSAETGNTVLFINDSTGEIVSVTPASNGSFTGRIRGQLGDEIKVVLMDYSGNQTLITYITFRSEDGKYLVTAKGGKVEGEGGSLLEIPEGALSSPAVISMTILAATDLPALQAPGSYLGAVNVETGGVTFKNAVEVSIPIPAGFDRNTPVFVTRPSQIVTVDENGVEKTENVYEIIDSTKIVGDRISSACPPFDGVWAGGPIVFTAFVDITPVVVSGYAYQEMNGGGGYQPAPDGFVEVPLKDPATGNLIYKYDRPVPRAVIRAPSSWNYVSYTGSKGFYGTFAAMFTLPPEFEGGTNCMGYRLTATHPATMFSDTFNGYACAKPYNVPDVNFKLAEKATIPPDREPPVVEITASKIPDQGTDASYINGVATVGTQLGLTITVTDTAMGTASLSAELVSTENANTNLAQLSLSSPTITNVGSRLRYTYIPDLGGHAGTSPHIFGSKDPGLVRLVVDARDQSGNTSSKSLDIRVVNKGEQPIGMDGAPRVTWIAPGENAAGVPIDAPVKVLFSEGVNGVSASTFTLFDNTSGQPVPASVSPEISNGHMKGILVPKGNLAYGHTYRVDLSSGISDVSPNASVGGRILSLLPVNWQFTTRMPVAEELTGATFGARDIDYYSDFDTGKLYAYVAAGTDGWRVVDVTNPASMKVVWPDPAIPAANFQFSGLDYRHLDVDQETKRLAVTDNHNLSVSEYHYGYIRFYSLQNPKLPVLIGREKLAEAMSGVPLRVSIHNGYAYVCTVGVGIQVIDIQAAVDRQTAGGATNGSSILGYFDTNAPTYYGSPVFFAPYRSTSALLTTTTGQLLNLDLSMPTMPTLVTSFQPQDASSPLVPKPNLRFGALAAVADFGYRDEAGSLKMMDVAVVGLTSGGVRVVDVTSPVDPKIVGVVKNADGTLASMITRDITVNAALGLAVAPAMDGVYIIDLRNPLEPRVLNKIAQAESSQKNYDGVPVMVNLDGGQAIVERKGKVYIASPATSTNGVSPVKVIDLGRGNRSICYQSRDCEP